MAQRAFENSEVTAEICGVSPQLVKNIHVIWGTLTSGFAIDASKFDNLCKETLQLYFDSEQVILSLRNNKNDHKKYNCIKLQQMIPM